MGGSLQKQDYVVLAGFRHALRQFLRFSEEAAHDLGIEAQQYQAMLAINGFPDRERITISELAGQLQIRHHSAVGLVNRSVKGGLLKRDPDTRDRRRVYVRLTARGRSLLQKLAGVHKQELRRLKPQLEALVSSV